MAMTVTAKKRRKAAKKKKPIRPQLRASIIPLGAPDPTPHPPLLIPKNAEASPTRRAPAGVGRSGAPRPVNQNPQLCAKVKNGVMFPHSWTKLMPKY